MGSPESEAERRDNERRHRVSVEAFAMGQYEVTFVEYDHFCTATGREKTGR
ncbi:SUMF1/EgtB/PvdO family nonheme iron enzyme [Candidatus Competibacter phosphatis]|uniref:SUMF1/EgtB/PvdO family nonheme iron enzyme n=1 Tax=Candidatus Competibacter phosphatis TaxID=221280 RepID=UPI002483784B|nr:SUMF1/EgtB/PvdO family nonheme iron enzyme [Candidatus Competibacter phosphatis]